MTIIHFPISGIPSEARGELRAALAQPAALAILAAYDNGADIDLTGAAIAMTGKNLETGGLVQFGGAFTGGAGEASWQQGRRVVGGPALRGDYDRYQ